MYNYIFYIQVGPTPFYPETNAVSVAVLHDTIFFKPNAICRGCGNHLPAGSQCCKKAW